jgi:hypothetical protein
MVQSTSVDMGLLAKDPKANVCESDAGAYYLPKTLVRVVVTRKAEIKKGTDEVANVWHAIEVQRLRVADKRFGFCLDYLAQASSDDIVEIRKYKDAQLLGTVTTDAIDQSRTILRTLIQTVFVAISGNPQFDEELGAAERSSGFYPLDKTNKEAIVFQAEFDPFDPLRSSLINDALNDFGFCILLDAYTFDARRETINSYCDNPKAAQRRSGQAVLEYVHDYPAAKPDPNRETTGLFYRPRVPYNFYLLTKRNRQLPGGWQLRSSRSILMENVSPILSVGLQRANFSQRKTTLMFDEGMLGNVCIYKGSELVEFVQIPLQVVKSVVALPANIIQVRINISNSSKALVAAEKQLIDTQNKQLLYLDKKIAEADQLQVAQYTPGAATPGKFVPEGKRFKPDEHLIKRGNALLEGAPSGLASATDLAGTWESICEKAKLKSVNDVPLTPPLETSN